MKNFCKKQYELFVLNINYSYFWKVICISPWNNIKIFNALWWIPSEMG